MIYIRCSRDMNLLVYDLLNHSVSIASGDSERTWKEPIVAWFWMKMRNLRGGKEEDDEGLNRIARVSFEIGT
jgi:hypothetical protein